jgi:hypothetical protein
LLAFVLHDRVDIVSLNGQSTTQFNKWLSLRGCRVLENCFSRLCRSLFLSLFIFERVQTLRSDVVNFLSLEQMKFSHFIIIVENTNEYIASPPVGVFGRNFIEELAIEFYA